MAIYRADFESRSACPIKLGGWRYAVDPSTSLLLCAIAREDEPVRLWDRYASPEENAPALELIRAVSSNPSSLVWAFNAGGFEFPMALSHWEQSFGVTPPLLEQWRCSAVLSRIAAAPASLDRAAEFFKLPITKSKEGSALIRVFSLPQKRRNGETYWVEPDSKVTVTVAGVKMSAREAWNKFREYCRTDVATERELHKRLKSLELTGPQLDSFLFDLRMNQTGIPVNIDGVAKAEKLISRYNGTVGSQFKALTGINFTQGGKFLLWLKERGYTGEDLRVATVSRILSGEILDDDEETVVDYTPPEWAKMTSEAVEALKMRSLLSFAALKKLPTMRECACPDGRIHGALLYYGARTGRHSGRLVQIQNFRKNTIGYDADDVPNSHKVYEGVCEGTMDTDDMEIGFGNPLDCLASSIRHFIDPGPDKYLLDCDLSGIEARCLGWLSNHHELVQSFRDGKDVYKTTGALMFGIPYEEVTKELRQRSKVAVLALGYGGGKNAFSIMANTVGLHLPEDEIKKMVKLYRENNKPITDFWKGCQNSAVEAISNPGKWQEVNDKIRIGVTEALGYREMVIELASKRRLHYPYPQLHIVYKRKDLENDEWIDVSERYAFDANGDKRDGIWETRQISYYGQAKGVNFTRIRTWGGSLVENIAQATAADFLSNATVELDRRGYKISYVVHDQACAFYEPEKGQSLDEMVEVFCTSPSWASDFPLGAEAQITKYYTK